VLVTDVIFLTSFCILFYVCLLIAVCAGFEVENIIASMGTVGMSVAYLILCIDYFFCNYLRKVIVVCFLDGQGSTVCHNGPYHSTPGTEFMVLTRNHPETKTMV